MRLIKITFIVLVTILSGACNHNLRVNDSKQKVNVSGTTYSYIVVRIEYINQLNRLCSDANPLSVFNDLELQKQAIATCVLSKLDMFNISAGQATNFLGQYCGQGADLSKLDDRQKRDAEEACRALGMGAL